jgi:predicted ATP-grasp superfamily ATP-dependent carboligase
LVFIFFTGKYYFSDENLKNSYRSYKNNDEKIKLYSENLPILENDTQDIIEYVKQTNKDKKKKFNFWKLLENDK